MSRGKRSWRGNAERLQSLRAAAGDQFAGAFDLFLGRGASFSDLLSQLFGAARFLRREHLKNVAAGAAVSGGQASGQALLVLNGPDGGVVADGAFDGWTQVTPLTAGVDAPGRGRVAGSSTQYSVLSTQ